MSDACEVPASPPDVVASNGANETATDECSLAGLITDREPAGPHGEGMFHCFERIAA